jgi:glycosyltransferase involved in cell wall biosynthesis
VGDGKRKIVYIGRFAKMKNVDALLNLELPEDTDLIFIGSISGGFVEVFDRMLKACEEKDNFHYVGPKYGQEKIDWLMAADAVIVPSTHEPFGIVALEALASRSILLSSFVNGMGDFLTEECAINCGTTTESISEAIDRFVSMTDDEKNEMKEKGLQVCREHDWEIQADKLFKLYDRNIKTFKDVLQ